MRKLWKIVATVASNLRGKQKLHLGIQTLITARSLERTKINYIYSCSPWKGNSFGSGPIFVNYSIRKLQYVIKNEWLKLTKICKNRLQCDISACILSYNNSIPIRFVRIWRRFHVELSDVYSSFIAQSTCEL